MKSNLDKWFQAAKDAEPVMSMNEVEAMIKTGVSPHTKKAQTGSTLKTIIIMGTTLLGLAGLVGFFTFHQPAASPKQDRETVTIHREATAEHTATAVAPANSEAQRKVQEVIPNAEITTITLGNDETKMAAVQSAAMLQPAMQMPAASIQAEEIEESGDRAIIELRNAELARFGIRTDGTSLKFISLMSNNDTSVFKLEISRGGYWNSTAGVSYNDLNEKRPDNLMPVAIEKVNRKTANCSYPMLSEEIAFALQNRFMSEAQGMLVGIRVTPKGLQRNNYELIFWYKPTADFMELLPEDMRPFAALQYRKFMEETYSSLVSKYLEAEKQHLAEKAQMVTPEKISRHVEPRTVELDRNDLKKIHIDYDGSSFEYKSRFIYKNKPAKLTITYKNNDHHYMIDYNNKMIMGTAAAEKAIYPVAFSDSAMQDINFIEIEGRAEKGLSAAEREKKRLADFIAAMDTLVGVRIPVYNNHTRTLVILWFEPTAALKQALPSLDVSRGEEVSNQKIDMTGIKLLELDDNSLMWLGVSITDKGISVPMLVDGHKALFTSYSKNGTTFTTSEFREDTGKAEKPITITINDDKGTQYKVAPETVGKQYPSPVLVTDDLGRYWRSYRMDGNDNKTERKLMARISTLIPVLVRSGETYTQRDKQLKRWRPDVILWYEPTPQFLEWLPELMGKEIGSEYEAITNNQPAPTCKYFDACLNVKGKVKSYEVYPNPVVSDLKVLIELEEDRGVNISLTDISGKAVKTLLNNTAQQAGSHEYTFDLAGMPEGMYLLFIETDKNERIIQRLIVK